MCQAVGRDALGLAREMMSGKGQASGELNALQCIAAAASEPLLALGRSAGAVIFSSLGSTTAVALTSSLSILRLGFGGQLHPQSTHCHLCKLWATVTLTADSGHPCQPYMPQQLSHGPADDGPCCTLISYITWHFHCRCPDHPPMMSSSPCSSHIRVLQ